MPLSEDYRIIAPYWADVDTRETGDIFYRQSTDSDLLARASREIKTALLLTYEIEIKHLLIATWDAVGYYDRNADKVFLIIITVTLYNICIICSLLRIMVM